MPDLDLAGRLAIKELDGPNPAGIREHAEPDREKHKTMVDRVNIRIGATSLRYYRLDDLVKAIGSEKKDPCTHCWDGSNYL
jgi:amidophosphoribosyltransferase